jgi:hypothetical protein
MRTAIVTLVILCAAASAQAAKGGCKDPGIQWTINPDYVDGSVAAIQGDGAPYANGQPGVTAVIQVCSGTYDATLNLQNGRSFTVDFSRLLASNSYTPSWALAGEPQTTAGFLNVRNLWFVPMGYTRNDEYTFTTRLGSTLPLTGSPGVSMLNPGQDATISDGPNVAAANYPYPTSLVVVHHCPANTNTSTCPNIVAETWMVYPDSTPTADGTASTGLPVTQVATLLMTVKRSRVNAGQFSIPFMFTIAMLN